MVLVGILKGVDGQEGIQYPLRRDSAFKVRTLCGSSL